MRPLKEFHISKISTSPRMGATQTVKAENLNPRSRFRINIGPSLIVQPCGPIESTEWMEL